MKFNHLHQKRIAIFQAEWPLQIHTNNISLFLAKTGYHVDLFLYKTDIIADIEELESHSLINVWRWSEPKRKGNIQWIQNSPKIIREIIELIYRVIRIKYKIYDIYEYFLFKKDNHANLIPRSILQKANKVMKGKEYQSIIGVEKLGLIWAFEVSSLKKIPLFYYSLELFDFNSNFCTTWHNKRIKKEEELIYPYIRNTLIQDQDRAKILNQFNNYNARNFIYLPVSCIDKEFIPVNSSSQGDINILSFGQLDRYGIELTNAAQKFPEKWQLILHDGLAIGLWNKNQLTKKIKTIDKKLKVRLSLKKLNNYEIRVLIRSSKIGLVFYPNTDINSCLTAFSSEKISLYLRDGIPIITFRYQGYEIFEKTLSGVSIDNLSELNTAIHTILNDHEEYSKNARKLFEEKYDFEKNISTFLDLIQKI